MKNLRMPTLLFCAALLSVGCTSRSLKSDPKAEAAVTALQRLDARLETGITRSEYSTSVGEANFQVKQFLESDKANSVPKFTESLVEAMKWYKAAGDIWSAEVQAPVAVGYCQADLSSFQATGLCKTYPELVTTVPGKGPTAGSSQRSSAALVNLSILVSQYLQQSGKTPGGSPGIIYGLARQASWRRASFASNNAQKYLTGAIPKAFDELSFKDSKVDELAYLTIEAKKSVE